MYKRILALLLVAIMSLSLAACAQNGNKGEAGNIWSDIEPGKYEVTYGEVEIDWISMWDMEMSEKIVEAFNEEYPTVKVNILPISWLDVESKAIPALAAETCADVFYMLGNTTARAEAGQIVNLEDALIARGFDKDEYVNVWNAYEYEGDAYGLPAHVNASILYYNKDHFEEAGLDPDQPPTTWAQLVEYAEKLTKYDEEGNVVQVGFDVAHCGRAEMTAIFGGDLIDVENEKPLFTSETNRAALQGLLDVTEAVGGYDTWEAFYSGTTSLGVDGFFTGDISMVIQGPSFLKYYQDAIDSAAENDNYAGVVPDIEVGYTQVPTADGSQYCGDAATWTLEVTDHGDADRLNAAVDFVVWYVDSGKVAEILGENTIMPKKSDFDTYKAVLVENYGEEMAAEMEKAYLSVKAVDYFVPYPSYTTALNTAYTYASNGTKTVDEALAYAQEIVEREIKNYHMIND